jgi:hypothetical protein
VAGVPYLPRYRSRRLCVTDGGDYRLGFRAGLMHARYLAIDGLYFDTLRELADHIGRLVVADQDETCKTNETTQKLRYEITIDLSEEEGPQSVYAAIEELLTSMGQIGTLSMRSIPDDD